MTDANADDGPSLADVGESAVLDAVIAQRPHPVGVHVGPGDDAAVLAAPDGRVVASTDTLVQDRHFRLDWSTPEQVGRRAIAQNAADIEAMGARPTGYLVALVAPADTTVHRAAELSRGAAAEAARTGASVVGGDLVAGPLWTVTVTVLGDLGGLSPVLRSGARPGDVVAVAGELGRSAAGYRLLAGGVAFDDPELADLVGRYRVPQPPYGQGPLAAAAGASAMTDVSDGLVRDLGGLAVDSRVGVDLDRAALAPDHDALAAAARAVGADAWDWVFGGGEDHALVATFGLGTELPTGWRPVGRITAEAGIRVDGRPWSGATGWDSFG
ncbi:thiamine-monophosphate kinase [Mycolicibacterium insubricum]|uniref:Thiamine-monophosphate kinase n=1 Tax=Mycolicibacterium insubricum TaxID=444597 RepID=A0A1X0DIK9_9MYCO|nr:thiamine-phosphate kinase [Mycolicibacterium insubricum]MCB9439994.1 thiamine-phosphate kinase [Mycolicibacterium sp.]ORA72195.1 thiamine-phosphate kinase [Mycolicibacterium insubricum]BBZ66579.1 thiamine-monophosphate kinase [Mycolicibacterium insubricum]